MDHLYHTVSTCASTQARPRSLLLLCSILLQGLGNFLPKTEKFFRQQRFCFSKAIRDPQLFSDLCRDQMVTLATGDNKKPGETVLQCAITREINQTLNNARHSPIPRLPDKEQDAFFDKLSDFRIAIPALMNFLYWSLNGRCLSRSEDGRYTVKHVGIKTWGSSLASEISTMQSSSLICFFGIGQTPVGAEGDRVSSDRASHIANLKVQPVLFHLNISQRDQAPGLFCFTPGNKNPPTN